jgi:hypothetical protein
MTNAEATAGTHRLSRPNPERGCSALLTAKSAASAIRCSKPCSNPRRSNGLKQVKRTPAMHPMREFKYCPLPPTNFPDLNSP